jgi:hypothetical protein
LSRIQIPSVTIAYTFDTNAHPIIYTAESLSSEDTLFAPGPSVMAIEEPDFELLTEHEGYEVRRYEPYLVAEVDVVGDRRCRICTLQ